MAPSQWYQSMLRAAALPERLWAAGSAEASRALCVAMLPPAPFLPLFSHSFFPFALTRRPSLFPAFCLPLLLPLVQRGSFSVSQAGIAASECFCVLPARSPGKRPGNAVQEERWERGKTIVSHCWPAAFSNGKRLPARFRVLRRH